MSYDSYMQKVSLYILEKMKAYPCVVDLFLSAHTLSRYPDDYRKGIEEEKENWEMIDRDCGEQERITPNIYEIILPDIPQIVQEGLLNTLHVGNRDCFDWIKSHAELKLTKIGNYGYNGRMEYLTTDQAKILANKLLELTKSGYVNAYQEFYSHPRQPLPTEIEAKEYFNEVLFFCQESAKKDYAFLLYIY